MGVLLVANHPVHGERRLYLDSEANVGSHHSNHLVLTPPADDYTARFLYRDARIIVTDLRSVIGTFVNGRRIVQATIVRPENVVGFGEWSVRIDTEGRKEEPFATGIEARSFCSRTWDKLTQIGSVLTRHCRAALARLPAAAPPPEHGVMALPFFSHDEPPSTVGALLSSLHVPPPTSLRGGHMGFLSMPSYLDKAAEPPPPSPVIRFLSVNYAWDMYHENPKRSFAEIEHRGYEDFGISFTADGDLVENWLRTRFGTPREATNTIGGSPMVHRIYGNWLYYEGPGAGCSLSWERRLPDWAMAPTDKNVALRFLHEFSRLLGRADCTHAAIKEFGSRPPARSGIVVTGPLNRDDFWLTLEPKLGALEIAHALGVEHPFGSSGDLHMSSWSICDSKSRLGYPRYGHWVIEVHLDRWPSGADVPGNYATKQIAPKDLASSICIRPFAT